MTKPTSQQVPEAESLSAEQARILVDGEVVGFDAADRALRAIASGHHVVISATELSALRAREERLRELLADIQHTCAVRKNIVGVDLKAVAWAHRLESILNEGKT